MAIQRDANGNHFEIVNGVRITHTQDGIIIGEGLEAVQIGGNNLKVSDPSNWIQGHYPDYYPFTAPHRHPEEDIYKNFALDPNFPPDGIPLDRLPKVIREMKKASSTSSSIKTDLTSDIKNGDLVVWDSTKNKYVLATCSRAKVDWTSGLFFSGVADTDTGSVIASSTVTISGWNLTPNAAYFLDCSRPGKLTTTDTGYFVGIAQGPHTLYLAPLAESVESIVNILNQQFESINLTLSLQKKALEDLIKDLVESGIIEGEDDMSINCAAILNCVGGALDSNSGLRLINGRLEVDLSAVSAARLQTIISTFLSSTGGIKAVNGKMSVDFSMIPASQMQQIVLQMVQTGGGISVSNGKLYVDFSAMPDDKFKNMLKSIRVPFWLPGNTYFYVNGGSSAASDTASADDSDWGLSAEKPFKTIQAAVNYICENYNFSSFNAIVLIHNGSVYNEALSLPDYSSTTGKLYLRSWDGTASKGAASTRVQILNQHVTSSPSLTSTITVNSNKGFVLENLKLHRRPAGAMTSSARHGMALTLSGTCSVDATGCHFCTDLSDGNVADTPATVPLTMEVIRVSGGGTLRFSPSSLQTIIELVDNQVITNLGAINIMNIGQNSSVQTGYSSSDTYSDEILVRVTRCGVFCYAAGGAFTVGYGTGYTIPYMKFALANNYTMTGKRYVASNGGKIMTGGRGSEYFPGSVAGTVETASYSWYT